MNKLIVKHCLACQSIKINFKTLVVIRFHTPQICFMYILIPCGCIIILRFHQIKVSRLKYNALRKQKESRKCKDNGFQGISGLFESLDREESRGE